MQDSFVYFKNLFLSLLAMLGLISQQEIQENTSNNIPSQHRTILHESSDTNLKEPQEIIDQNPVSNPDIKPEDVERMKMFSERFCGQLQAQLFQAIISMNIPQIDDALARGADLNRATNYILPLDEAIESAISKEHLSIVEHLCAKGAIISNAQLERLEFKKILYDSNIVDNRHSNDIVIPVFAPPGTHLTAEERAQRTNEWLERKKGLCDRLLHFLANQKTEQARLLQAQATSANSSTSNFSTQNLGHPTSAKSNPSAKL